MKPQPRLQDMPCLVKRRISSHIGSFLDKMALKSAFPAQFRPIIGDPAQACNVVSLTFGRLIDLSMELPQEAYQQKFTDNDLAIRELEMLLDNQNLSISTFSVLLEGPETAELLAKLERILKRGHLKVTKFTMSYEDQAQVLQVLPHLNPGALRSLSLKTFRWNVDLDEIVKLEQWKQLEELEAPDVPLELWWNIPKTEMKLKQLKLKDLSRIVEHFREAADFEQYKMITEFNDEEIVEAMGGGAFKCISGYQFLDIWPTRKVLHIRILHGTIVVKKESRIRWHPDSFN